ncbi:MAG: hypothetical protein WBP64_20685, partial [Nitrososphaeraceae archaeon]
CCTIPFANFPHIRDLVTDVSQFHDHHKRSLIFIMRTPILMMQNNPCYQNLVKVLKMWIGIRNLATVLFCMSHSCN